MDQGHRVTIIDEVPGPELGCQLTEGARQHRGILAGELPGHPDLSELTMRVLHHHAGLACASQPAQDYRPRPGTLARRQPGTQFPEQFLPARQGRRPRRQPHRLPCHRRPLVNQLAHCHPAMDSDDRARPEIPREPGPG